MERTTGAGWRKNARGEFALAARTGDATGSVTPLGVRDFDQLTERLGGTATVDALAGQLDTLGQPGRRSAEHYGGRCVQ